MYGYGGAQAKARKDGSIQKTFLERAGSPTFDMLVELVGRNHWRVYRLHLSLALSINIPTCGGLAHAPENSSNRDVATTVDNMLAGKERLVETRWIDDEGRMMARFENLVCDEAEVLLAPHLDLLLFSQLTLHADQVREINNTLSPAASPGGVSQ